MKNILLCGGSGTRLWPISRTTYPKQFIELIDDKSLFQLTVERNNEVCDGSLIVTNQQQYLLIENQLSKLDNLIGNKLLIEPIGRNTAPAIALACLDLDPTELVLVTPSDHFIEDQQAYQEAVALAKEKAKQGRIVTLGLQPKSAHTGFGYIEIEKNSPDIPSAVPVLSFHEKPNETIAKKYFESEKYYWNAGIFCFQAGVFLEELKKHSPEIYEASVTAYSNVDAKENDICISLEDMQQIPEDSIDYAVLEKSTLVDTIVCDLNWSDIGSFDALYDHYKKDENGNTQSANLLSINSHNNLVYGTDRLIATIDIDDCIIVDTGDALLVSKKGSSQKVKTLVSELKKSESNLNKYHLKTNRPWGSYTVLEDKSGYKIKRIEVLPGKRLSLQKHFHRSEHWVVVSGTATVTAGDKVFLVRPNESTYIKVGEVHRLGNDGKIPIIMIEVQVGEYTGEDDIVRIEDDYKRK